MNKINWFFIQWYFIIVNSTPVPDVTIVLQKKSYGTTYEITSVLTGEHLNSGIAWIQPFNVERERAKTHVSKYVPAFQEGHNCKIGNDLYCTSYWTNGNHWKLTNSHFTNLDIVTDNRWEEFKILYTDGETKFYQVDEFLNHKNKLTLHFSIRIEKDAHIFLCENEYVPTSKCYWILLGGYGGALVALRKCMENQIKLSFDAPQGSCAKYQTSIKVFPEEYLGVDSWKHFTISINENNIVLKSASNDYILLNYTDNKSNYINIRHLHVRSAQVPAYWKFHTYEFTYTTDVTEVVLGPRIKIQDNKSCISFYAAMCLQCSLSIETLSIQNDKGSVISKKEVLPQKEFKWQEVKLSTSYTITVSEIQLYIHTQCYNNCDGQFWAIDNFRICADDEVRVLNVEGSLLHSSFQIVDGTFSNLQIRTPTSSPIRAIQFSDPKCPIGSIGSTSCTTCAQVFGSERPFCDKGIICDYSYDEEGFCRCSPGYTGVTCENDCYRLFHGYDCKESCGLCEYSPCDYITGDCPIKRCLSNFTDPQCKTPPHPILINPPIVTFTGDTNITIKIHNSSYYGMGIPATFRVIYKLSNDYSSLYETELYDFYRTNQITLGDLHSDTPYTIYIVLVTEDNKFYNGSLVPKTFAKTTCIDLQEQDIIVTTTNSSAVLTFQNKLELCPLKDYEVHLDTRNLQHDSNNQFPIQNLIPYQPYTLNIRNLKTGTVIYHMFRTKEGDASTVSSVRVLPLTPTTLTISWEKPVQTNGQIRYYSINYKHVRYLACSDNEVNNEKNTPTVSYSTNITLENLIPYSEYNIDIAAVTIAAGKSYEIRGYTISTDTLDENEIPRNVSVQVFSTEAEITLDQAKCSDLKGDIDYYISARCTSDWCLNKISTLNSNYFLSRPEIKITGLLPYTLYAMDIKVARKNGNMYNQELFPRTFRTLPTAPRVLQFAIYEESEDILRLRIDPEYPPTGELQQYFVRYCIFYNRRNSTCIEKYFEPVRCKIWKNYNCIDISENLKKRTTYRVYIQARNKNVTELGTREYHTETTAQRKSYAPEELSYFWDNFYNLTLQWNHPNITNGPLTKFIITIEKDNRNICYQYDYMVTEVNTNLTYNYKIPMENNDCYTSLLTATIQSFNIMAGSSTDLNMYSPPEMPALNSEPFVEYISNTSFTLSPLSAKKAMHQKSFMYIVLSESQSKFEIGDFEDTLYKLENLKSLSPSWIIAKYNLNEEKLSLDNLTIGINKSSDELQNDAVSNGITLSPGTSYTITILMYSEYQERKRYRVYEIVTCTSGTATIISSNGSSNHALIALFLIFLLPILLWIYIRKRKTGRWCSIFNRTSSMLLKLTAARRMAIMGWEVAKGKRADEQKITLVNTSNDVSIDNSTNFTFESGSKYSEWIQHSSSNAITVRNMNKINWFFIQWYFIIVNSTPVPDVTIVLQKRPYSTAYDITSVLTGKHLNSGIAWIQPFSVEKQGAKTHVSKYVPAFQEGHNCKIGSDSYCTSSWTNTNHWKLINSHFTNLDIVTDNRWEEFKILYTDGETTFYRVDEFLNHKNKLTFHFSIRIEKDAHIFLCEDSYVPTSKCYWILLGGYGGVQVALRKCMENQINHSFDAPRGSCLKFQASIKVLPKEYFGVDSWKHFTISINENNIVLKSASTDYILLNYTDTKYDYINIHHLHVRSTNVPAYWKFHTYEFTYTTDVTEVVLGPRIKIQDNKSCISFYAAMCLQCSLLIDTLSIQNDDGFVISNQQVLPQKEFKWQEVKLSTSHAITISEIQLSIHTQCYNNCEGQFWAIDNFRICADDEVRVLNVEGRVLQSSFQIVDATFRNLQIRTPTSSPRGAIQFSDPKCPIGSIGSTSCTTCIHVFGSERSFCNKGIICDYSYDEEGFCRCSPGYTGVACENDCYPSYYGYDCKESCGLCEYHPCDHITGDCPIKKCLSNFTDPQCKTPSHPILINPPIVTFTGDTNITIEIHNSSYYGMGIPATFKVIFELSNDISYLYETELYDFYRTNKITLGDLHSDTSYTIYIVLVTEDNKFYNGSLVPKIVVKTTCVDLQEQDIIVTPTNTSAVLTFQNKRELCPLKDYEVHLDTRYLQRDTNNQFPIQNLIPYQRYTLNIRNLKTGTVIYHMFRTKEGVPSTVSSVIAHPLTPTTLTISWEEPVQPNGQIRYYTINFKHVRYLACSDNEVNNENTPTVSYSTNITLENLLPYSEYNIDIAAVTIAAGKSFEIRGYTTSTDTLDETEIPNNVSVQLSSTEAAITLNQAECSFLKGDIDYFISARCTSDWCLNKISTLNSTYFLSRPEIKITGLLPYTMYAMDIKVARKNGNMYNQELFPRTFRTLPTAPRVLQFAIYEESEDILRLRIDPEYPPTGELQQYFVKYCIFHNPRTSNCIDKYFEPVRCKIWKNYNCIDISENLKKRTTYRVYIQARNKNVTELGTREYHTETTAQRRSYAPEELSYSWDNFYNLTLQWNHPNITNGPLTKFIITIAKDNRNNCYQYDYMVTEEITNLTYNYTVPMENTDCYTSQLTAKIEGFNIISGASSDLNMYSPPEMPALNSEPFVKYVSNTSFTLSPLSAKKAMPQKSFMYIVLSESQSKFEIGDFEDTLYKLENLKSLSPSWIIAKYNLNEEKLSLDNLTIGSNKSSDLLQDDTASNGITLSPNTSYTITILMYSEYQKRKRYRVYEIVMSTSGTTISNDSSNLALLALILLFLLPLLLWIYIRKRKTGRWCSIINRAPSMPFAFKARIRGNPDVIPLTKNVRVSTSQIIAPPQIPLKNISNNINVNKVEDNKINNEYSKPIKVTDFDKYVRDSILNGELERQHSLFVRGQTKPWDYGALPQNKSKNRYNNLIAYDHTRVQLEKINNDPYSDYINANYIEGYKTKKAYIATQGPKVATINDFWRMIWQDNVKHIVMLANVIEGGKKKTEQYWPNINETSQFGNISVKYISTVVSADYEYRTFLMTSNNTERKIEQLHFTSWPDHGVPMYSQSLVPLFRKLLTIPQGNSPIVVHCSAGVGRTGTVILCDLCLRMSAHEGVIDALKHQRKIREQRANLVDNLEQYKLAHLVLLECLINPDTSITCDEDAEKNILKLLETDKLEKQFRFISEIAWQDQAMRPIMEVDQKSEWKQKNRVESIFASGYGRVYLSRYPVTDEHSDYINAVEVDGFKAPKRFIATQQPLPNTISDFWRMVDEKEVSTIVSLNSINKENNRSCVFWPTSKVSKIQPVPYLSIKFISKIGDEEITIVNLELHNRKHKDHTKRDIKLIKLKGWPADQLIPKENVSLIKLWNETEKVSKGEHPIVVTCHEGATACGLFLALTFVIEKIKLEHQCDVCLAVRTVRHNREQFVQELDQFNYLYRAAITYLSCFELYANFS